MNQGYWNFEEEWGGIRTFGYWVQPLNPRAVVVLVHGFGEHSGRYLNSVVPVLTDSGCAVLGFDLVGHGRSGGKKGHCKGYMQLMEQLGSAFALARDTYPGLPIILYGHSMGGNLALNFVLRKLGNPHGVVASSPYLRLAFQPPSWKIGAGKLLKRLFPSFTMPSGLEVDAISRDPVQVEAYKADPLVHDLISPNYAFPVIEAGEWAISASGKLDVPVFIAHGTGDCIIDPQGSAEFAEKAKQCHLFLQEGGYHELHHDLGREEYFEELRQWLDNQLPG